MTTEEGCVPMTITLPLQPQEEARLIAVAQAKGLSTDALVREAVDRILADAPDGLAEQKADPRPIWERWRQRG